jgi:DNA-binding transcriptional regulator LsrR (DeoR family)
MPRKSYLQEALIARTGREDLADYLRELYIEKRLTDQEIAGRFEISRGTVQALRKEFGIDRSERKAVPA